MTDTIKDQLITSIAGLSFVTIVPVAFGVFIYWVLS